MKVLGIDPGKRETWYALLQPKPFRGRVDEYLIDWLVKQSGHLELDPDTPVGDRLPVVRVRLQDLLGTLKPSLVVAERYIIRPGMGRGNVSEIVNLVLGILWEMCTHQSIPIQLVTPSAHKGWWGRTYFRDPYLRWSDLTAHEADACSVAIYGHHLRCTS
jgi:Holliday junction resolvasome RuvABC endonuclease subunit